MESFFDQQPYECKLEWGYAGAKKAANRNDILVVVDILSFSTATTTAIHHDGIIYPCSKNDAPLTLSQDVGAEVAVSRKDVPERGQFSLSPLTYMNLIPGTRVIIPSPNGATCSRYAQQTKKLFIGSLLNAKPLGELISKIARKEQCSVTILACGERWKNSSEDGDLRFAIEDYLGAGAILSHIQLDKSPEALLCQNAFYSSRNQLKELLWDCGSGVELRERGFSEDVIHSSQLNIYCSIPVMNNQRIEKYSDINS